MPLGCGIQQSLGSARLSAASRAASKRNGRRMKGLLNARRIAEELEIAAVEVRQLGPQRRVAKVRERRVIGRIAARQGRLGDADAPADFAPGAGQVLVASDEVHAEAPSSSTSSSDWGRISTRPRNRATPSAFFMNAVSAPP